MSLIDTFVCGFHLTRTEFSNRLLTMLGGLGDPLIDIFEVGLSGEARGTLDSLGGLETERTAFGGSCQGLTVVIFSLKRALVLNLRCPFCSFATLALQQSWFKLHSRTRTKKSSHSVLIQTAELSSHLSTHAFSRHTRCDPGLLKATTESLFAL